MISHIMKKKTLTFILIITLSMSLALTGYFYQQFKYGKLVEIEWVDCVKINNFEYYSGDKKIPVSDTILDGKIGEVKFNVSENVHDSHYTLKNGDATFLEVGTEIFSIKSESDTIAVMIDETYYLYKADRLAVMNEEYSYKP